MYIVIEGQDATGKDTQAKLLADYLRARGEEVTHYAESGTDSPNEFTKEIARLNYGTDQGIDHRTRVLLFLINRYDQWKRLAEPALKRGETVIVTRHWFSTLIYEGYGGGVSRSLIAELHRLIMPNKYFNPDKIVFLTLSDEARAKRMRAQEAEGRRVGEVWKTQPDEVQQKINNGYLRVAKDYKIPTLDADGSVDEIQKKLREFCGFCDKIE